MKGVNNVHLVCRNLHHKANLIVNPILSFKKKSEKHLASLIKSSRIFRKMKFFRKYSYQEKFNRIAEYIKFTGPHVKKLTIRSVKVGQKNFQKLLNLLPNLEALELDHVKLNNASEGPIKWALKSSKIKRIKMNKCSANIGNLLGSLAKCVIEEAELDYSSPKEQEIMEKFLKSQEKNLKKLTITSEFNFPNNLKDMRLEYLYIHHYGLGNISFEFLKQQTDLTFLKLSLAEFSNEDFSMICELKQLESLELHGFASDSSGLNNIYQLEKLKRLKVEDFVSRNIIDHLKFGVFEDLEELYARFDGASVEYAREMKRITPNLKKLRIQNARSDTINALLESLKNLEKVTIGSENWENSSEKVCPKVKHLEIYPSSDYAFEISVDQLTHQFPNLEFLKIDCVCFEVKEPFFVTLLSGLKRLKTLRMYIRNVIKVDSEFVLPCFEKYGSHLKTV